MSKPKLRSVPLDQTTLTPLSPEERPLPLYRAWQLVSAKAPESCRWECIDGRFVSLTLGSEGELGKVVVTDSGGRRETVGSYEDALALAKSWRTE